MCSSESLNSRHEEDGEKLAANAVATSPQTLLKLAASYLSGTYETVGRRASPVTSSVLVIKVPFFLFYCPVVGEAGSHVPELHPRPAPKDSRGTRVYFADQLTSAGFSVMYVCVWAQESVFN